MKKTIIIVSLFLFVLLVGFIMGGGASNFDRLVLGEANFGEDPNTTADITGQNDEYISNYTNGRWDFGSANLLTTGTLGVGALTTTSLTKGRDTINGAVDSLKISTIAATDYLVYSIKWVSGVTMDTVDVVTPVFATGKLTFTRKDATNGDLVYDYLIMK
jgi:hypothetical protein